MASEAPRRAMQTGRVRGDGAHDGFLRHNNFQWLKIAGSVSLAAILAYLLIDVQPRPNGGSWYGYILGTVGAGLIVWLTLLGLRKRTMTPGAWSLKAWTSAHVYLGLSLIVIGTLHTGFQFGWNVHTLAYALMMLVILSGVLIYLNDDDVERCLDAVRSLVDDDAVVYLREPVAVESRLTLRNHWSDELDAEYHAIYRPASFYRDRAARLLGSGFEVIHDEPIASHLQGRAETTQHFLVLRREEEA